MDDGLLERKENRPTPSGLRVAGAVAGIGSGQSSAAGISDFFTNSPNLNLET